MFCFPKKGCEACKICGRVEVNLVDSTYDYSYITSAGHLNILEMSNVIQSLKSVQATITRLHKSRQFFFSVEKAHCYFFFLHGIIVSRRLCVRSGVRVQRMLMPSASLFPRRCLCCSRSCSDTFASLGNALK